ncbi:hypothetical protein LTS18_013893, partial [Coniosporium uncinatum]
DEPEGDDDSDEASDDEEDTDKLKKTLNGLKRKGPSAAPSKPAKKSKKGPKREIEYEFEKEPPQRELAQQL